MFAMECSIISPALSLLMKHLVTGQRQKAPNFSAFQWSPHSSQVSIGQHFVTTKVVYLPKGTETINYRIEPKLTYCSYARPDSDQAVRAMHSCNSWFFCYLLPWCMKGYIRWLSSWVVTHRDTSGRHGEGERVEIKFWCVFLFL